MIEEISVGDSSNTIKTFKYEYDSNNNWIKKTAYYEDGDIWYIEEREFEYY